MYMHMYCSKSREPKQPYHLQARSCWTPAHAIPSLLSKLRDKISHAQLTLAIKTYLLPIGYVVSQLLTKANIAMHCTVQYSTHEYTHVSYVQMYKCAVLKQAVNMLSLLELLCLELVKLHAKSPHYICTILV